MNKRLEYWELSGQALVLGIGRAVDRGSKK
jgi:hypothetical protein